MNQKDIYKEMSTQWPWEVAGYKVILKDAADRVLVIADCECISPARDKANAEAIVTAVNWWQDLMSKGINPEAVEEIKNCLLEMIDAFEGTVGSSSNDTDELLMKRAKKALTAAKL